MQYRSFQDMNNNIIKNLTKFVVKNVDLVVGIPRSGMLPANLIAMYLNKPFTDINSFLEGKIYSGGNRFNGNDRNKLSERPTIEGVKNVLIVDDSIGYGVQLGKTKQQLKPVLDKYNFTFAAIFARSHSKNMVDIYCEIVDGERVFEWNIFHQKWVLMNSCMDIDGVICKNPKVDDDGEQYLKEIKFAQPLFIPSVKVKTLISCRLEKYRKETEEWLALFNVKYDNLIMLNLPNKEARQKWNKHGEYKAAEYKKSGYAFFIESSLQEAKTIKAITEKPVFCTEIMNLV